ncbi:hypothetical protein [Desulfobotulus mexicanus]|uniref:Uncharacterized protein n=1 Tax=Desulfobotulus mexicanus TaxID=2586642 RepID=A0A5Q4VGC2_9BACT|nr:hypothetical protein [Desulfobotulus mexicanus]TYT75926.1 hypothetical protein FIM25_03255 [Desulfobotulus mexicanus]
MSDYLSFVVNWFKNHGKDAKKEKDWEEISIWRQKFYLVERIQEEISKKSENEGQVAYRIIYGYHLNSGKLQCRIWYYSGSEANWRASTGFRKDGSWAKGAERIGDDKERKYTQIGYVNECFVTAEMHDLLENFWEKAPCSRIYRGICPWGQKNGRLIEPKNNAEDYSVFKYMAETDSTISKIKIKYNEERKFKLANFPENVDKDSIKRSKEIGSVLIQKVYGKQGAKNAGGITRVGRVEVIGAISKHGQIFKHDTILNEWIVSSLASKPNEKMKYHPVLKMDYSIKSYLLIGNTGPKNSSVLVVEIASTLNPREHTYKDFTGTMRKVNTPVCWVRDVYYFSSVVTSFGTRKEIPVNLSFLVQKPCDYPSQASKDYNEMIGVKAAINDKGQKEFQGDLGGGKYVILSLLNEATSSLIKAFKDKAAYPRFREKYHRLITEIKHIVALKLPLLADGNYPYEYYLRELILYGIKEYLAIQMKEGENVYDDKGFHGADGIKRANALYASIEQAESETQINQIMYKCFKENKVGDFSGGWFSGINTHPTSLFTCVCRSLLAIAESPVGQVKNEMKWSEKSAEKCINRMIEFMYARGPDSDHVAKSQHITKESENLLKALKGEKIKA